MNFSKRGSRIGRYKLRWSRYYEFILGKEAFYLKQKAYTNHCDGYKAWEIITRETYKKNVEDKGHKANVVDVGKNVVEASTQALTLIINIKYQANESDMRKAVIEAQEAIRYIRNHSNMNKDTEYRVFKRILRFYMQKIQEEVAIWDVPNAIRK